MTKNCSHTQKILPCGSPTQKILPCEHEVILTEQFHRHVLYHPCRKCDCRFITLDGYNKHELQHNKKAEKIISGEDELHPDGCNSEFSTADSFKNHKRKYHPVGGIEMQKCSFSRIGCKKMFMTRPNNLQPHNHLQHEAGCTSNANRVELICEVCKQGKFWLLKKLQEHKHSKHNWH